MVSFDWSTDTTVKRNTYLYGDVFERFAEFAVDGEFEQYEQHDFLCAKSNGCFTESLHIETTLRTDNKILAFVCDFDDFAYDENEIGHAKTLRHVFAFDASTGKAGEFMCAIILAAHNKAV